MGDWRSLTDYVAGIAGAPPDLEALEAVSGGCINEAAVFTFRHGRRYFVKRHDAARLDMFAAEADGLKALRACGAVRVPAPLGAGAALGYAFLVLEHLSLSDVTSASQEALGRQLAALHRATQPQFGWHRDNAIGTTPQRNSRTDDWIEFWRRQRLDAQLHLAADNGAAPPLLRKGERLLAGLRRFFDGYAPPASLLHGDLWAGNAAQTDAGEPVLFDPAVYYGDREADIAMTELFGGFSNRFYSAYREAWPLDPGYRTRRDLYNLYHVLNHGNLFGGGYWARAEQMIDRLLAEID